MFLEHFRADLVKLKNQHDLYELYTNFSPPWKSRKRHFGEEIFSNLIYVSPLKKQDSDNKAISIDTNRNAEETPHQT